MKRKIMVPVAIVLLVLLDQLVKWYVVKNIPLGIVKSFIPHVVSLTYLQNTGAAFSLLENQQWFFTLITLVDFMNFAIFNVADSYSTVGVFLLLILMLKEETHGN